MRSFMWVYTGIANIQSDVKGVTVAQEIEVHLKQVIFLLTDHIGIGSE
jgi:hypothetical protein